MPNTFSGIARDIFTNEFECNTGVVTFSQISGWLSANLGALNNLINTSFSGADPEIDTEAQDIFQNLYLAAYYNRQAQNSLRGIVSASSDGSNILSVSDGDNRITFVNKNEVAKVYKGMSRDFADAAQQSANRYCMYLSAPVSVNGIDTTVTGYGYGVLKDSANY